MAFEIGGTVTFTFDGVWIEGFDFAEARHEVELMDISELMTYNDGTVEVDVRSQRSVKE